MPKDDIEDSQLRSLNALFSRTDVCEAASNHQVVWGHVKGHPLWPVRFAAADMYPLLAHCLAPPGVRLHQEARHAIAETCDISNAR